MRIAPVLVLAAVLSGIGAGEAAAAVPPPTNLPTTQPVPNAHPYPDVGADPKPALDAAFAEAKRSNRDVLIDLGANWCPDCRILSGVMNMDQVKPWFDSRFVEVLVNVDHFNRNMDIPARYGVHVTQIPTILVVTPDGKLLNPDGAKTLGNARAMTPQADIDLIASWDARRS